MWVDLHMRSPLLRVLGYLAAGWLSSRDLSQRCPERPTSRRLRRFQFGQLCLPWPSFKIRGSYAIVQIVTDIRIHQTIDKQLIRYWSDLLALYSMITSLVRCALYLSRSDVDLISYVIYSPRGLVPTSELAYSTERVRLSATYQYQKCHNKLISLEDASNVAKPKKDVPWNDQDAHAA